MITKKAVIDYFDTRAPLWDANLVRNDKIISIIMDNAAVSEGARLLDVACGTGVLIPDYLKRNVASITAVDIAPKMIDIARSKFSGDNVRFLCCDAETADVGTDFDVILVYNAFPHFANGERLIERLSGLLATGGTLTIAHGISRAALDKRHLGAPSGVSLGLMSAESLAGIMQKTLTVTTSISNDEMYQVCGRRGVRPPQKQPQQF